MIRSLLISAASLAAFVIPAEAQALDRSITGVTVHSGFPGDGDHHWRGRDRGFPDGARSGFGCDNRRDRGRRGGHGRNSPSCSDYGDYWSYYQPEINRSWVSDSYNDWWHDRPDRAFPRWVQQRSESCEPDRMWWSGAGWRC